MSVNEQLAEWRHNSKWHWLHDLLSDEYRYEFARLALRNSKLPRVNFKIDANLRRLLGVK